MDTFSPVVAEINNSSQKLTQAQLVVSLIVNNVFFIFFFRLLQPKQTNALTMIFVVVDFPLGYFFADN